MKSCLALTSFTACSLLWLSPTHTATAAGLTLALSSTNTSVGSLVSVAQVETATAVGTITSTGNAKVTLTSADIDGGTPLVLLVPVASGDTSSAWAAEVRDALSNDLQVAELFEVGGTNSTITLTRKAQLIGDGVSYYAANDSTLNLALENDTATGITTAISSEDTTDAELSSTAQVETATADGTITVAGNARVIVTADGLSGSPKTYPVAVLASDSASAWATKVRTALGADSNLTSLYDVGGSSTSITLTRKKVAIVSGTNIFAANDPTLNINIDNFTCAGIIPQSISVNTTAGSLQNVGQVETATALGAVTSNGNVEVVVTSEALVGSPKKISVPVTAGDSTSTWATKVRAALNADAAVSSLFTASGTGSKIILSRNADNVSPGLSIYPDNDSTLNLSLFTGSNGIVQKLTSVDTMAGALSSQAQVETATAIGTIAANGNLEVVVTAAGLPVSPKSINVSVLAGDTASVWAGKVRTAFNADSDITNLFVVGGAGDTISLTSKLVTTLDGVNLYADNDPTLYFAYAESDTDGDGLKDKVETNTGIFISATNTGTNPNAVDTDGDGINDDKETGTGIYVSLNNTGTNPNVADSDGDGLTDKQEIDGVGGFKSNPFLIDTDGDLVSDFNEVNATPPTDPNDPSKYPSGFGTPVVAAEVHASPVLVGDEQSVAVDQSSAPYGHRPDRDKFGDDGSGTIIDRNGVLIWSNKNGERVTIPKSTFAKTLHVSNTECLVYSNRFADGWNSESHVAQIVMHRRGATGGIISSTPLNIDGTVLDTAPVTPTTYGYMLVSGKRSDNGNESVQITQEVSGSPPTISEERQEVDKWDLLDLTLNIITWDGARRTLAGGRYSIPKSAGANFSDGVVLGYGSDGSLLFNMSTAATFLDRYDDLDPGAFASKTSSIWVSATINKESVRELGTVIDTLAYVDNDRLIGQTFDIFSGANEMVDYRQFSSGFATLASSLPLPAGENILPLAEYSRRGFSPYIYTIDAAGTSLKLYRADATITSLGTAVTLPFAVSDASAFVRNPRDGSLLIKSLDGTLMWVPTSTNGTTSAVTSLGAPKIIPDSSKAKALFVTSKECVVWLNGDEPAINGTLPPVKIVNYQINGGGSNLITFDLTPPIEGSYAAISNMLSPDPDLEGWYITTFEKDAPESVLMRTYHLQLAAGVDRDKDGITDYDEITGRFNGGVATDPYDSDTDDDGFADGRELLPFVAVNGSLTWEEARSAASEAGGRLVVLDGQDQQDRFAAWLAANKPTGAYWVGGHDTIQEGSFSWLDAAGGKTGSDVINPKNWAVAQPSNLYDADGMQVTSNRNYKWSMAPISTKQSYIIEFARTNPLIVNDSTVFDTDGDGVSDYQEVTFLFTDPNDPNSFAANALGGTLSFSEGRGNYESLLYHINDGYGFKFTLNVTAKGAFSGSLEGNFGKASVRGKFMADGTWSGNITNGNAGVLNMKIAKQPGGSYAVQGFLATPTGGDYFFHARRAVAYAARKTTFEASLVGDDAGPTGSAIATGGIAKGGKVTQHIYNLNGVRATYAGSVLEGDYMALYARTNGAAPTVMLGNVALRDNPAGKSDFDGIVRLFNRNYDQERSLSGAYYTPSTMGTLPLPALRTTANNAVFSWSDGRFDGVNKVASWLPSKVTVPTTQNDRTTAKFDRKTGLLSLTHTRTDATRGLVNSKSNAYAVVVQGKDKLNGFYTGAGSSGGFSVQENSEGLLPESTNISPLNKTVSADGMSYNVDVTTVGAWTVAIPSGSWVAANVTSGNGNGTVRITVQPNTTNERRETSIKIAGYIHTITQSYR